MATTRTPNLGLLVDSNLTAQAKYNLQRLDALGASFYLDATGSISLRSSEDVILRPNDASSGGSGTGGTISLAVEAQPADTIEAHATLVDFTGVTTLDLDEVELAGDFTVVWDNVSKEGASVLDFADFDIEVSNNLDVAAATAHIANLANPHQVTAAQVGAYTTAQTDTLLSAKADTSALTAHTGASTGVHGVTSSLVGTTDPQELTNKVIDAGDNTILGLTNVNLAANAAIDGSKVIPEFGNQQISTDASLLLTNAGFEATVMANPNATENTLLMLPPDGGNAGEFLSTDGAGNLIWEAAEGAGTVTSVDVAVPSYMLSSGGPITSSGEITLAFDSQAAGRIFAGPDSGGASTPSFRALAVTDIPSLPYTKVNLTGSVVNADISPSAAIVDTKLATIATAGKVSNSATTATSSNNASTIVARDASGNFDANEISIFDGTARELPLGSTVFDLSSTGAVTFAGFTITGGNTTFTVGAGSGLVVDHVTDEFFNVSWSAFTGQSPATATGITYVYISRAGALVLSTSVPTSNMRRDNILLGRIGAISGTITGFSATLVTSTAPNADIFDIGESLSTFRVDGLVVSANGANLNINRSAGHAFQLGINFSNDHNNPNIRTIAAAVAPTLIRATSTTITGTSALIDPTNYDSSGTLTAIPGSNNRATIQRIYQFTGSNTNIAVQYGAAFYGSLTEAIQNIAIEDFTPNPNTTGNTILIGVLCVTKGCTDLSNTSQARFFKASRFGETAIGPGGTSVSTLQNAYNNSVEPEILTDSTLGALSIKRGSAADTDTVIEVLNGSGTVTSSITGAGKITGTSWSNHYVTNWVTADGTTKTVTHSLGTTDVVVDVYDVVSGESLWPDTTVRTSTSVVTLTSSSAPPATNWRVLVRAIT